ncbi:MAG: type II toxin-antitoxin system mRNA interferase toxin, RelE/StbE family [Candidatus Berkelbacteria bacterium]|nr:type II toxin-antitoxin system mRNA interferase toxin, RelE/StbE family [Candidatus Berkelbacteria bacterium]
MNENLKRIDFSKRFEKQLKKAPFGIKIAFKKRFQLFIKDPLNRQLRNHPLKGILLGDRSINITGDWRAIYSEREEGNGKIILFEMLGTHSQLYK